MWVTNFENQNMAASYLPADYAAAFGGAYSLYLSINAYYQDRNIGEFVEKRIELNEMKKVLQDSSLYQVDASFEKLKVWRLIRYKSSCIQRRDIFIILLILLGKQATVLKRKKGC